MYLFKVRQKSNFGVLLILIYGGQCLPVMPFFLQVICHITSSFI